MRFESVGLPNNHTHRFIIPTLEASAAGLFQGCWALSCMRPLSRSCSQNGPGRGVAAGTCVAAARCLGAGAVGYIPVVAEGAQKMLQRDNDHQNYFDVTDALDAATHIELAGRLYARCLVRMQVGGDWVAAAGLGDGMTAQAAATPAALDCCCMRYCGCRE